MQLPRSFTGGQGTLVPPAAEAHWLAAYVVAWHEKAVAEQLALRAVESFLPLYRSLRYGKNRRAQVEPPLFPSYLFVRISGAERLRVLAVPGVVNIVTFQGTPVEVPDEEIASLRAALPSQRTEPFPYLASGTFTDQSGSTAGSRRSWAPPKGSDANHRFGRFQ